MTTTRAFRLVIVFVETLLISLALVYLAEYFDLPFVREAGGALA